MAMTAMDMRRRDALLNRLGRVWDDMSNEERSAVEVVVNAIILNHTGEADVVYPRLTEAQLFERIDQSLAEADSGEIVDAEAFDREIRAEFGLV